MSARTASILLAALALGLQASAAPAADPYVPPELEGWIPWVLEGADTRSCPWVGGPDGGDRLCAWPGSLELDVQRNGVAFMQSWTLYAEAWVPLPGDAAQWPAGVRAGERAVAVVADAESRPRVRLPAGDHRLEGRLGWSRAPASLRIPSEAGLVSLSVAGRVLANPRREGDRLWLAPRSDSPTAAEALRIQVWRRLADGLPAELESRVRLEVGGRSREQLLGRLLPPGFLPLRLDAPFPARLEPDGRLRAQLVPGTWEIRLVARADAPANAFAAPAGEGPWAEFETWSVAFDPEIRTVEPRGDSPVDPARAAVPPEWRGLPAFRLLPGEALALDEERRGLAEQQDRRLTLYRRLWLESGGALTAVDRLTATLASDWRLDMRPPWSLEAARQAGEPLLITAGPGEGARGVELRTTPVELQTIARAPARAELPATGWDADFDQVTLELQLPPSHRLLAAPGADSSPDDWLAGWSLADAFFALLAAVAAGRLLGWRWGLAAAALLILTWQEAGAPRWAWLAVLATAALASYAPEGRLKRTSRLLHGVALAALVLIALPFLGQQLTAALYPQLDRPSDIGRRPAVEVAAYDAAGLVGDEVRLSKRAAAPKAAAEEPPESPRPPAAEGPTQAGPGIPDWRHRGYRLGFSGPVAAGQDLRLIVVTPWLMSLIRIVSAILLALLAWRLTRLLPRPRLGSSPSATAAAPVALAGVTVLALLADPAGARAEVPDPAVLDELRARLLAPPACAPACATLESALVRVSGGELLIVLTAQAAARTAMAIPGSAGGWQPARVRMEGSEGVRQSDGGSLLLRVDAGVHRIELSGPLPEGDEWVVAFPQPPRRIAVELEGWEAAGLEDGRLVDGVLRLRRSTGGMSGAELEAATLPAFVAVERRVALDREWNVTTTVTRRSPPADPFTVEIPLLPGESVLDADVVVRNGRAVLAFGRGVARRVLHAALPTGDPLALEAPAALSRAETWQVRPGPGWRATFEGPPAGRVLPDATRVFRPRPGERLTVTAVAPEGVAGRTLALDRAELAVRSGRRSSTGHLELRYRSTTGGVHVLGLPPELVVTAVSAEGVPQQVRPRDGMLRLAVLPGEHQVLVEWDDPRAPGFGPATPAVDLGAPVANAWLSLDPGDNRWVLATFGPGRGPAVLYWSELLVFLVIAVLLARYAPTPLKARDWLLLGLGFSTFSWGVLIMIGAWIFAISARDRLPAPEPVWQFNLLQAALGLLTLLTLLAVAQAVPQALLGSPRMHIAGSGGGGLGWFLDRNTGELPAASAWTLPLWVWQAAMLAWALWLVFALVRWLRWAWRVWTGEGLFRGEITLPRRAAARGPSP